MGFLATALLTRSVRENAARWGLLDVPAEARKIHKRAMPTGGGLAIAGGVAAGTLILAGVAGFEAVIFSPLFWLGALLMLGTGFWDDRHGVDAKGKFLLQAVAAYLLLHAGSPDVLIGLSLAEGGAYSQALLGIPLSMIWIVGIINAVNLIDGVDGLAAGVMGIAFLACAALFGLNGELVLMGFGLVAAATLGGFLLHNFKPASIFMGDSGSLFAGYLLAAYTLQGTALHPDPVLALLILPVLLGVPVLDTTVAIARRLLTRQAVFGPDKDHIHHRLISRTSEKEAVLTLYGVSAGFGITAILMNVLPAAWGYVLAAGSLVAALWWVWGLGCLPFASPKVAPEANSPQPASQQPPPTPMLRLWPSSSRREPSRSARSPGESVEEDALA